MVSYSKYLSKLLSAPWEWRFISSVFQPEPPAENNMDALEWHIKHSEVHVDTRELLVPLSGECFVGFNAKQYRCVPGTIFLFDCMDAHDNGYNSETTDIIHLWASFIEGRVLSIGLRAFDSEGGEVVDHLFSEGTAQADWSLNQCWSELKENTTLPASMKRIAITGVLIGFLSDLLRNSKYRHQVMTVAEIQKDTILKIKGLIEKTAGRHLTLDRLADIAGYDKYHLHRIFKESEGVTPHQYINECRIKTCKAMLDRGEKKKDIAEALGFSTPMTFSRWLRNIR